LSTTVIVSRSAHTFRHSDFGLNLSRSAAQNSTPHAQRKFQADPLSGTFPEIARPKLEIRRSGMALRLHRQKIKRAELPRREFSPQENGGRSEMTI
jgi:hypothetical protein